MGKEMLIRMLVSLLGEYLIKPATAGKYAKYFVRARDYLLLLFPLERFPEGDYGGTNIKNKADFAVPANAVGSDVKVNKGK